MKYTPQERLMELLQRSARDADCRLSAGELESAAAWLEAYADTLPPELSQEIWALPNVTANHYSRLLELACREMVFPEEDASG